MLSKSSHVFTLVLLLIVPAIAVFAWTSGKASARNSHLSAPEQASQEQSKSEEHFICPPCGCESDGKKFEAAGTCPDCGMELVAESKTWNVAIMIWDGVELLDFAGPGEVFSAARGADGERFNVFTVSKTTEPILSQGFVTVTPAHSIADCPKPDIIVLPGGGGRPVIADAEMMEWIKSTSEDAEIALTVCTGAFILGKAGMLDDLDVTTWHGALDALRREVPKARVHDDRRFIDNGHVVTSAGVSAGIDSALHVVTRLMGLDSARNAARYMEYDWRPEQFGDAEESAAQTHKADADK